MKTYGVSGSFQSHPDSSTPVPYGGHQSYFLSGHKGVESALVGTYSRRQESWDLCIGSRRAKRLVHCLVHSLDCRRYRLASDGYLGWSRSRGCSILSASMQALARDSFRGLVS
jgi:hypothetical protein